MNPDYDRLQTLLQIAREYRLSFDDLDEWTRKLDWKEFQDLSRIFTKTNGPKIQNFPFLFEEEIPQPYVEIPNDSADKVDGF